MLRERGGDGLQHDVVERDLELVAELRHRRAHLGDALEVELRGEVERRNRADGLATSRRAIVLRICVSGTSWKSPSRGTTGALGAARAAARGAAAPAAAAASTSRLMMRPPGPEPWTACRSSPRSAARRRASGEDRVRPPLPAAAPALRRWRLAPARRRGRASAAFCCGGVRGLALGSAARARDGARAGGLAAGSRRRSRAQARRRPARPRTAAPATSASMFSSARRDHPMSVPTGRRRRPRR